MLVIRDPVVAALFWGSLAAVMAAIGAIPSARRRGVPGVAIGLAYALASGLMLAGSYLLMEAGLHLRPVLLVAGAIGGAGYSWWIHFYSGIGTTSAVDESAGSEVGGYKLLLQSALHSASEGVAIGTALAISIQLGVFIALTLAVHNIAEGMVLSEGLRRRGMSVGDAATFCVITNIPQPLLAVASVSIVASMTGVLPVLLGFAGGSLLYLVMTELLPGSYVRAGKTLVALVVSTSAALVVMLKDLLE